MIRFMNEDVRDSIQRLVSKVATKDNHYYMSECIKSLVGLGSSALDPRDWRFLKRAMDEFSDSFSLYTKYRDTLKICLFGSARTKPDDPNYLLAEAFSKAIVEAGFMVVTGAGPGIMEAGNKGAGTKNSFGVNINLPFEQDANQYINKDAKLITYRYFFIRKLVFIRETDATVLFPGGFGTLDEAYECLTLLQTGRAYPRPVVLMEAKESMFWEEWLGFFDKVMLRDKYISPDDLRLLKICKTPEEACAYIKKFYSNYHSIRYFDDNKTVIRLKRSISSEKISDILDDKIIPVDANDEEKAMKDVVRLPRLLLPFNQINYGRLLDLIFEINEEDL